MLLNRLGTQLFNQIRNFDFAWTDCSAFAAADTKFIDFFKVTHTVEERCENGSDSASVDMAVYMPTDKGIHRANIET